MSSCMFHTPSDQKHWRTSTSQTIFHSGCVSTINAQLILIGNANCPGCPYPVTYRFQRKNHWNREFDNSKNNLVLIKLSTLEKHASQHLRPTLQRGTLFFFIACLFFKVRLSGKHRNRNTGHGGLTCHESILWLSKDVWSTHHRFNVVAASRIDEPCLA